RALLQDPVHRKGRGKAAPDLRRHPLRPRFRAADGACRETRAFAALYLRIGRHPGGGRETDDGRMAGFQRSKLRKEGIVMKKRVLVIHGPNINLTGERETGVYGKDSFDAINREIRGWAEELGLELVEIFQSNSEGAIID